jgi:hypothetical protein
MTETNTTTPVQHDAHVQRSLMFGFIFEAFGEFTVRDPDRCECSICLE